MLTISPFRLWEEWINVCVGAWLIAASWLFNVSSSPAKINFVIVGALVVTLAAYKLWNGAAARQGAIGRVD
jgi:SPW repeat-containing protein